MTSRIRLVALLVLVLAMPAVSACSPKASSVPAATRAKVQEVRGPSTYGTSLDIFDMDQTSKGMSLEAALKLTAPGFRVPSASVVGNPVRVFPQSTAIPQSQRGMNVLFSSGLKMFTEGDHVSEAPKITGVQWPDGTIDEVKIVRTDGGPLFEHEIVNGVDVWFMKPGEQLLPNGRRLPLGARAIFVIDSMEYELISDEGDLKLTLAAVDDILKDSK